MSTTSPILWRPGTPNFYEGRAGESIRAVAIHRMVGYLYGTDSWFKSAASGASTHFGLGYSSIANEQSDRVSIYQWVKTSDTAYGWAARPTDIVEPLAARVLDLSSRDLNRQVIHIELGQFHQGGASLETQPFRPSMYRALNWLLAEIDRQHPGLVLLEHNDVSTKPCPGPIDWSQIGGGYGGPLVARAEEDMKIPSGARQLAQGIMAAGTGLYEAPSLTAPARTLASRQFVGIYGYASGDEFQGSKDWLLVGWGGEFAFAHATVVGDIQLTEAGGQYLPVRVETTVDQGAVDRAIAELNARIDAAQAGS